MNIRHYKGFTGIQGVEFRALLYRHIDLPKALMGAYTIVIVFTGSCWALRLQCVTDDFGSLVPVGVWR